MSNRDLELPLDFRKALVHLREKFELVEVLFWDDNAQHAVIRTLSNGGVGDKLRESVLHEHNGIIYRKDLDAKLTPGFPVFREQAKKTQPAIPRRALRRHTVKRLKEQARDIVQAKGTTEVWMERRDLQRELQRLDYRFYREPTLAVALELTELRKQLNNIDQRLAFISQAAELLAQEE